MSTKISKHQIAVFGTFTVTHNITRYTTARAIGEAPKEIQIRHIGNCLKTDPAYGKGVARARSGQPPAVKCNVLQRQE